MLIDIDRYLSPDETDTQLLQLYAGSLLSGAVRQRWSPVLFLVALHHLNRFLFYTKDEANNDVRQRVWEKVLQCRDEVEWVCLVVICKQEKALRCEVECLGLAM